MTARPALDDVGARRARLRRALVIGLLLLLPRIALAWLVLPSAYDLTQIVVTLVFVAGLFVVGASLIRLRLLRRGSLLPLGLLGAAAILVAGLTLRVAPPGGDAIVYSGGLIAPAAAALNQWFYLVIGGISQLGIVLLVGSVGAALARRFAAR